MNPPVFSASIVKALPLAARGNFPIITSSPFSSASLGVSPTETISGSVKTIAGIATLSNSLFSPEIISATISPWALALCASIGSPATSPIA